MEQLFDGIGRFGVGGEAGMLSMFKGVFLVKDSVENIEHKKLK